MTAGAQVMVVEDEGLVALSLQRKLEKLGYRVPAVVASGEEAVELAGNLSPDLVLMDIMLDGALDGIDAASRLRERLDVPIVFLTAYSDDMTIERAKAAEPFGYLVKPCEDRELRTTIEMALNKHRTEREVRESERRLATTLKSIGDAVIITDVNASVTFMNPFAESMTGWPAGEAVGRHVTEVFDLASEGLSERTEHPVEKSLREGIVVALSHDTILRSRDGIGRPIDDSVAPIRDDRGHTLGAILVFRDTSERRRTEVDLRRERDNLQGLVEKLSRDLSEAMKLAGTADRAKSEFLATMSHELRTPLVGVLGMAELLRGTSLSRKQQHYMDVVLDSGRSLLAMIEDILEFASIDAKKPGAELADFAVRTMMEETVGLVRDRAAAKGLILSLDVAPDVASAVSGDRSRLQQVLLRLIGNAIKFTDTGLVDVRVQAAGGDDHEVLLRFEVEDTGIGISPRDQARIFDPFQQADGSMTRRHGGLGLGLAVAARMVEIMGGTLRVRSETGKGSCFFFVLPFRKPALGPR